MKIINLKQTCVGCPSQWEAFTTDGHRVYIRYRWGYLSIRVSDAPGQHGHRGRQIYGKQLGDPLDGVISWNKVAPIIDKL